MLYKLLTNEKRWFIIYHAFGDMAQLVERYVRNVQATSSNLVISTITSKYAPYLIGQIVFAINVKHRFE